jgi:hypothetical protein
MTHIEWMKNRYKWEIILFVAAITLSGIMCYTITTVLILGIVNINDDFKIPMYVVNGMISFFCFGFAWIFRGFYKTNIDTVIHDMSPGHLEIVIRLMQDRYDNLKGIKK